MYKLKKHMYKFKVNKRSSLWLEFGAFRYRKYAGSAPVVGGGLA